MVYVPPPLRSLTAGKESLRVEGKTVREAVLAVDRLYPGFAERICEGDQLRPGLSVTVGAQVAPLGLLQAVEEDSEIHFLPAIGGG